MELAHQPNSPILVPLNVAQVTNATIVRLPNVILGTAYPVNLILIVIMFYPTKHATQALVEIVPQIQIAQMENIVLITSVVFVTLKIILAAQLILIDALMMIWD